MLNYRFDITSLLTCRHPAWLLTAFARRASFPREQKRFLLLTWSDYLIYRLACVSRLLCCSISPPPPSFVRRFLDSFPGLRDRLWGCLQINSRGEIGTFQKQQSIPVYLQHYDVAVPDDKDCCICWVAAHKQYACFNCVWLLAAECIRHTNEKQGEVCCDLAWFALQISLLLIVYACDVQEESLPFYLSTTGTWN